MLTLDVLQIEQSDFPEDEALRADESDAEGIGFNRGKYRRRMLSKR